MVAASARRQGLSRRLLAAADERRSRDRGATELQLDSWEFAAEPLPFYEARGYRTIKRTLALPLT